MKTHLETIIRTTHKFKFEKQELSSIHRLWGLQVEYTLIEKDKNNSSKEIIESIRASGCIGSKEYPYVMSNRRLNLRFKARNKEYNSIEDLSRRIYKDEKIIRQQAISLLRKELPDYAARLLPKE